MALSICQNENILIVDSGSTKTDWVIVNSKGKILMTLTSPGINTILNEEAEIIKIIESVVEKKDSSLNLNKIYFYGAGLVNEDFKGKIKKLLHYAFGSEIINVTSDLYAAILALFGKEKGIACILGTGSNSCFCNNGEIEEQIPSLVYILGDEVSGAFLGKCLLNGILKKGLPDTIINTFFDQYGLSFSEILQKVYKQNSANIFLASFSHFIKENIAYSEIERLVIDSFSQFFEKNILKYPDYDLVPIKFTGSIAFNFKNQLIKTASNYGLLIQESDIVAKPIKNLIEYHIKFG